jgi:hypothetical protein
MERLDTDGLIDRLAAEATPVRPLAPAWERGAVWLALALPPLALVIAVHGLTENAALVFGDARLMVEQTATLLTAITAAAAAFASTIPGADRRWLYLPLLPLTVWLLALGEGCVQDWLRHGWGGLAGEVEFDCFWPMVLIGVVPTAAMVLMLRRGAALAPRTTLFLGALAVAAVVNFGLRFFHAGDASIMVLVWHIGVAGILVGAAGLAGPRLMR